MHQRTWIESATILVTGGCGFIGSNFIRFLLKTPSFNGKVINLDKLTYAGNPISLDSLPETKESSKYQFIHGDICDSELLKKVFSDNKINLLVHFAAESHVDRSIFGPKDFISTNVMGTFTLLEAARESWKSNENCLFHHVSTDEVYGSLGDSGLFTEKTAYDPHSPYSASKASSDHLVNAWYHTYGLPITMTNCSNNYGPYQFPEKLIPLMILNAIESKKLPVYGDGQNVRDWLFVDDHCEGIWRTLKGGKTGETYNIGGNCEMKNLEVVKVICELLQELKPKNTNYKDQIEFVKDRPGHDWRYAIDCSKIETELDWTPSFSFKDGIKKTISWYLTEKKWVEQIRSGEYKNWLEKNYMDRS